MNQSIIKKNRVLLADYPYVQDIENRLLMADLSVFEVDVIKEILLSSVRIEVDHLLDNLNTTRKKLDPALEKLNKMNLLTVNKDIIDVNKEMRKYYEFQIEKFDDDFHADFEFLRSLLNKVPIHVLPQWYPISKTSNDIFSSIVEKFFQTPKIYQRYLDDLTFDEPILRQIMDDLYQSPDLKLWCHSLLEKYSLSRIELEEYLLILEFNFVCCLSYNQNAGKWEEVITPFYEWKKYLQFQNETTPVQIKDVEKIVQTHSEEFGFVEDMTRALLAAQDVENLQMTMVGKYIPHEKEPRYIQDLIDMLVTMGLASVDKNRLLPTDASDEWIKKPLKEQAMYLYRFSGSHIQDKDVRSTEKSLKQVMKSGWIYFDDFMKGFTSPIGDAQPVFLQCTGKRWRYILPKYTDRDIEVVRNTIFNRLFQCGMVKTGKHNDKLCFSLTPFGISSLD